MQFLAEHWQTFQHMAKKRSKGITELEEKLLDIAVDKAPRAVEIYNPAHPSGCTLEEYVFDSVRRYMLKHLMTVHIEADYKVVEGSYTITNNLDNVDEVHSLLKDLTEYERWLLLTYHSGYNFREMAEAANVSKCTIRNHYIETIHKVRNGSN